MTIVYTETARQDLRDTYAYIASVLLAPEAAQNLMEQILRTIRSLETLAERNPLYRDEPWHSLGVRFVPVKNYLVFYTIDKKTDTVYVVRIMYSGRDVSRQLWDTSDWPTV